MHILKILLQSRSVQRICTILFLSSLITQTLPSATLDSSRMVQTGVFAHLMSDATMNNTEPLIVGATVRADGLTCSLCHRSVYKALKKLAFVEKLLANLDETSLDIQFVRGSTIILERIEEAIQDADFSLGMMNVLVEFPTLALPTTLRANDYFSLGGSQIHVLQERSVSGRVEIQLVPEKAYTGVHPWETGAESTTRETISGHKTGSEGVPTVSSEVVRISGKRVYAWKIQETITNSAPKTTESATPAK